MPHQATMSCFNKKFVHNPYRKKCSVTDSGLNCIAIKTVPETLKTATYKTHSLSKTEFFQKTLLAMLLSLSALEIQCSQCRYRTKSASYVYNLQQGSVSQVHKCSSNMALVQETTSTLMYTTPWYEQVFIEKTVAKRRSGASHQACMQRRRCTRNDQTSKFALTQRWQSPQK